MPVYLSFVIRKASDNVAMQMDRGVTNSQVRSGREQRSSVSQSQYFLVKRLQMFCMPGICEDYGLNTHQIVGVANGAVA